MIRYALTCDNGHEFESWFAGSDAYDMQAERGLVTCPHCSSAKVSKAIMAPALSLRGKGQSAAGNSEPEAVGTQASSMNLPSYATGPVALIDEKQQAIRAKIRELHKTLTETSDNMGENFAREARAIHDGDAPRRSIFGEATIAEARELLEEGIPILPLPSLPDDRH